jgi:hypothetical protein
VTGAVIAAGFRKLRPRRTKAERLVSNCIAEAARPESIAAATTQ